MPIKEIPGCRFCVRILLTLVAVAIGTWITRAQSAPLEEWHWRNPLPQGNAVNNVKFVNGAYLAVGELGTILTSSDGTNWVRQTSGTTIDLRDCAYGAGKYVVVGEFGMVLTSADAVSWTSQYAGTFYSLNAVTHADGRFVAVGEETTILTSADGATWTQRASGNWELFDVIHSEGIFVAAGGTAGSLVTPAVSVLLTSSDAISWTYQILRSGPPFVSLASGAGKFAAVGRKNLNSGYPEFGVLWISEDGLNWQQNDIPTFYQCSKISHGNGKWIVAAGDDYLPYYYGTGVILASDDLLNWAAVVTNTAPVSGVVFGGGKFISSRVDGTFLISSNGSTWANPLPEAVTTPTYFRDLKYLNGAFRSVGYNELAISTDGVSWTNMITLTNVGTILSITYGNGRYVAGSEYRTIWTSTDGVTWTNPAPSLSIQPYVSDVSVAYGNGVFVGAAGYSADILTSSDGINWTVQQLQTNEYQSIHFSDVTFGNDHFVAVAWNAIATSSDGTNWFLNTNYHNVYSVAGGNGTFVAVGNNTIMTSNDGTNWITQSSSAFGSLSSVAFGGGFFVATGGGQYGTPFRQESPIWISTDGINWSRRSSRTSRGLGKIAFGNGTFVLAGEGNAILQSDPLVTITVSLQSPPRLLISGPINRSYQIEFMDTLNPSTNWTVLNTITTNEIPAQFIDTSWTNSENRFYRAVLLP